MHRFLGLVGFLELEKVFLLFPWTKQRRLVGFSAWNFWMFGQKVKKQRAAGMGRGRMACFASEYCCRMQTLFVSIWVFYPLNVLHTVFESKYYLKKAHAIELYFRKRTLFEYFIRWNSCLEVRKASMPNILILFWTGFASVFSPNFVIWRFRTRDCIVQAEGRRGRPPICGKLDIGGGQVKPSSSSCVCTSNRASAGSFSAPGRNICLIIRHMKKTLNHLLQGFVNPQHCIIVDEQQGSQGSLGRSPKVKVLSFAFTWLESRK